MRHAIFLLLLSAVPALAQLPTVANGGARASRIESDPVAANARHFEVTVKESSAAGAIVEGGYYDWAPGEIIPQGETVENGISMPTIQTRWKSPGRMFIRDLNDQPDDVRWSGMLVPDGVYRYETVSGAIKTIPALRLVRAADPVAAYNSKAVPAKPKTGAWMFDPNHKGPLDAR